MNVPSELKYTKDHEWAQKDGAKITIGITDHAQSALGDVVFVDLPAVGRDLRSGETFGTVESIKAVSDLFSPLAGKVVAVNSELGDDASVVNKDPYKRGWMIKIEPSDATAFEKLLDSAAYQSLLK